MSKKRKVLVIKKSVSSNKKRSLKPHRNLKKKRRKKALPSIGKIYAQSSLKAVKERSKQARKKEADKKGMSLEEYEILFHVQSEGKSRPFYPVDKAKEKGKNTREEWESYLRIEQQKSRKMKVPRKRRKPSNLKSAIRAEAEKNNMSVKEFKTSNKTRNKFNELRKSYAQEKKGKKSNKRSSVWTLSGGAPGLGKRKS